MGKCKKLLHDLSQTFTDIRVLHFMNMCQILSIMAKKLLLQGKLELVVLCVQSSQP